MARGSNDLEEIIYRLEERIKDLEEINKRLKKELDNVREAPARVS